VRSAHGNSFDHLVGAPEQWQPDSHPKCCSGFEVDEQLYLGGLQNWQIGGLVAVENAASVDTAQPVYVREIHSIAHQATCRSKLAVAMNRRHLVAKPERSELLDSAIEELINADHQRTGSNLA